MAEEETLETVKVEPTSEAPTALLCWQRPALDGDVDPMLPACDRRAAHKGKHSWELLEEVRLLSESLKKEARSVGGSVRSSSRASALLEVAERLDSLLHG